MITLDNASQFARDYNWEDTQPRIEDPTHAADCIIEELGEGLDEDAADSLRSELIESAVRENARRDATGGVVIDVELSSPNGPKVIFPRGTDAADIEAALLLGWEVDWESTPAQCGDRYALPLFQRGPLASRLVAAVAAAKIAEDAWYADDDAQGDAEDSATGRASLAADAEVEAARAALIASDEERAWKCFDDYTSWIERAGSSDELLDRLAESIEIDWSDYREPHRTDVTWYRVSCPLTDEEDRRMVLTDPPEPRCIERDEEHDWQEPHSALGGLRDNPGVWSSGPGVSSRSVCAHCGAYKTVDSGAQDSGTGRYYTSTSYEEADEESTAWVTEQNNKEDGHEG